MELLWISGRTAGCRCEVVRQESSRTYRDAHPEHAGSELFRKSLLGAIEYRSSSTRGKDEASLRARPGAELESPAGRATPYGICGSGCHPGEDRFYSRRSEPPEFPIVKAGYP